MVKRAKNWQPDIYDLAANRPTADAPAGVDDRAVAAPVVATPAVQVDSSVTPGDDGYDEYDELLSEPTQVSPLRAATNGKPAYRVTVKTQPQSSGDLFGLGGMIGGAIAGALFGLLLAPKRGEQTRRDLVDNARQRLESTLGQSNQADNNS